MKKILLVVGILLSSQNNCAAMWRLQVYPGATEYFRVSHVSRRTQTIQIHHELQQWLTFHQFQDPTSKKWSDEALRQPHGLTFMRSFTTPIHYAIKTQNKLMIQLLLREKIPLENVDDAGNTPLLAALYYRSHDNSALMLWIINQLLDHGANVNAQDPFKNQALHIAAKGIPHSNKLIQLLIAYGADIDACNRDGHTPFDVAAHQEIVAEALRSDPKLWKKCQRGFSLLAGDNLIQQDE